LKNETGTGSAPVPVRKSWWGMRSITFSAYLSVFITLLNIQLFEIPPKIPPKLKHHAKKYFHHEYRVNKKRGSTLQANPFFS
jgi:hypothetical protein